MDNVIKKQVSEYNLIATAHHEAGHAVCGLHNFWYISNVDVLSAPHYNAGETLYFDYNVESAENNDLIKSFIFFDLQATAAGLIAEKMYYKDICGSDKFPMHLRIGSSDDIAFISKQIRKYKLAAPGNATHFLKKQIAKEASSILINHWPAVKAVAHQLYQKKTLSFDELKYILTRKTEHKEFWKDRFKKISIIHSDNPPDEHIVRKLIK